MPLPPIEGLILTGTVARCGKTVALAGISAVLHQEGFQVQAMKPIEFLPATSMMKGREQAFLQKVLPSRYGSECLGFESAHEVNHVYWNRLIDNCRKSPYPALIETPNTAAAPLGFIRQNALDSTAMAQELGIPILIVTPKSPQLIGQLIPTLTYLRAKNTIIAGWLGVETSPNETPYWDEEVLYITHEYQVAYLGTIPHSPSISVEGLQQGNLIKITETNLDLLPLLHTLRMYV
jgi:dethiobiotin synthetase